MLPWIVQVNQTVMTVAFVMFTMTHHDVPTATPDLWARHVMIFVSMVPLIQKIQCVFAHKPVTTVLVAI